MAIEFDMIRERSVEKLEHLTDLLFKPICRDTAKSRPC